MDARRLQAVSQRLLAELRQAAGARKAPHVRQDLYSVMAQQGDEVLDRAGRMAQGPDGLRLGHVTCLLGTWVPVFCDRQRRGRLCRLSAGRPPVPGLGGRDRPPRTGGQLGKPWNCIAADCWIMCNWWCAICPPLNASIPLSPPGWAYRSAGVAAVWYGSTRWCLRCWTRRRHSASPQGVTIWPSRRRTGRPWRRFTRRRWPPGGGTTAHRDCGPIIRTITPLSCWIPTATISRWSITAPPGAVRLRYRSPS